MSLNPGIVLLLSCPQVEVSRLVLGSDVSVEWVLYSISGKAGEDMDIGIDPNDFVHGMFILPFDVTPTSAANMEYLSKKEA